MSRTTTDILFGVAGQALTCRVMEGRPTSATFIVVDDTANDDTTAPEFSGTATIDSVNTTVDVSSGPSQSDPTRVSLASTSSIVVGRKYLLSENGLQEWVEVLEIVTNDYVRVRHPLRNDYSVVATFVGTTLTATVDAAWASDENNISDHADPNPDYRVRWEIIVGGVTQVVYTFFDLVRSTVTHQVDISDLNARAPGLADSLPTDYRADQGRALIDSAWRSVQAKLASLRIDTDAIRDDQIVDELTIMRALNLLALGGWTPLGVLRADYVEQTSVEYNRFIEQHFQVTLRHSLASGPSSGVDASRAQSFWSK